MRPNNEPVSEDSRRVAQQLVGRLAALGIEVDADEDAAALGDVAAAIERFEDAVESRGGDLMVDEAPRGSVAQPDNADFVLPRHTADESLAAYAERLNQATDRILQG